MTQAYSLQLELYHGPLDKLLELIEARKMDVSEISLGKVTEDFLLYIKALEQVETPFLADFILIASRLIFLKSKALLPDLTLTDEEEADIHDLERRLALYRELKPAMKQLDSLWHEKCYLLSRPYFFEAAMHLEASGGSFFYPGNNVTGERLVGSLKAIFESFHKMEVEARVVHEKIVTIEEKIQEVVTRLQKEGQLVFGALRGASAAEAIIAFLAILHLARDERIHVVQEEHFSDIIVSTRKNHEA